MLLYGIGSSKKNKTQSSSERKQEGYISKFHYNKRDHYLFY
jgi:hypothetical protein